MDRLHWDRMLLCLLGVLIWTGCDTNDPNDEVQISIRELRIGNGDIAESNKIVTIHYTGTLVRTGEVFDSSLRDGRSPLTFQLQTGLVLSDAQGRSVIDGFVRGIPGMRVGGRRSLTVPPQLAWGSRGAGCNNPKEPEVCVIPPNSPLRFEIELLAVQNPDTFQPLDQSSALPVLNSPKADYPKFAD